MKVTLPDGKEIELLVTRVFWLEPIQNQGITLRCGIVRSVDSQAAEINTGSQNCRVNVERLVFSADAACQGLRKALDGILAGKLVDEKGGKRGGFFSSAG